ncbi:MAG: hypothetical protein H6850_04345 [Alphaproteobacteria bacterium]|nr:MAG: hypothetical protein H6850_04345 [Alphaproteobacteria bacterium]
MFFLTAAPCQGGFYLGGTFGRSAIIISKKDSANDSKSDDGFTVNVFGGYGLVTGGLYMGGRARLFGRDFTNPDTENTSASFSSLEFVCGQYITPSTLVSFSIGPEISWNKKWGVSIGASSRTMITGVTFVQIEGNYLFSNKITDTDYKRAMRFMIGGGYNF